LICTLADNDVAFDDQSSTFIIPSGAGFEVVFCPGARSTNILTTERDSMLQLAQNGHVSKDQSTLMKREESHLVRRSGARQSLLLDSAVLAVGLVMAANIAVMF
jgi:beta-mannosidase